MAHFCENRKNHGKITAVYIAVNLLKLMVSNAQNTYCDDVTVTYSASKQQSTRTLVAEAKEK